MKIEIINCETYLFQLPYKIEYKIHKSRFGKRYTDYKLIVNSNFPDFSTVYEFDAKNRTEAHYKAKRILTLYIKNALNDINDESLIEGFIKK